MGGVTDKIMLTGSDCFEEKSSHGWWARGDSMERTGYYCNFDASLVVPTAEENRVKNIALLAQIRY